MTTALPAEPEQTLATTTAPSLANTAPGLRVSFKELALDQQPPSPPPSDNGSPVMQGTNTLPLKTATAPNAEVNMVPAHLNIQVPERATSLPDDASRSEDQSASYPSSPNPEDGPPAGATLKRPNSFSGPAFTQPRAMIKGLSTHSMQSPRTTGDVNVPAPHLRPLDENDSMSPALKRPTSAPSATAQRRLTRQRSEKEVLVGTPVKEGHHNYVLMYDMLTGIRVTVSRCEAKPRRKLEKPDFKYKQKLSFDSLGNEVTPAAKFEFEYKDYAPWVFREIRKKAGIEPADYLTSLTEKYILSEISSAGKSGSFFYYSSDYRFIIKTIHPHELRVFLKMIENYHQHICDNPNSLLCRIYNLARVKLPHGRKVHFVVMGNVFPPNKDIHEVYDLKGSTFGREYPEDLAKDDPRAVLKDLNWINRGKKLELGPQKRQLLVEQLERDVEFLVKHKIMDYSLLIGIHDLKRGNKENIRDQTLAVYDPNPASLSRQNTSTSIRGPKPTRKELKRMMSETEPLPYCPSTSMLPDFPAQERTNCVFYQDHGGFASSDERNEPSAELYYIGVIDIFTKYNVAKRVEHFWKSMTQDAKSISAVHPRRYGRRFLQFMKEAIRGYTLEEDAVLRSRRASGVVQTAGAIPVPVGPEQLASMEEPGPLEMDNLGLVGAVVAATNPRISFDASKGETAEQRASEVLTALAAARV
ncbi:Phosphatidylinositol-4-phosphate 5-kinase [Gaertneriomyces sp. JEL0708]|nr:Phosphatidylinositol-4-phosphate 5-kinase [Gaertneriomyces sp. JEL0708]